jgi:hypothetical protein
MKHFPDYESMKLRLGRQFRTGEVIRLADTPNFPLAFQVPLTPGHAGSHGNIGVQFEDFTVTGVEAFEFDGNPSPADGDRVTAGLRWGQMAVSGRYRVTAKATPLITLDTGGGMMDLEEDEIGAAGASSATPPLPPAERDAMLDRARDQRTRLMDDPNGAQLLSQYNQYNEIYNTVFVTSPAARTAWAANGATKDMAEHTHGALDPKVTNAVKVNPKAEEKTFGQDKVAYNVNAFRQQLQIAVNTVASDPNFDPYDPNAKPDPNSQYTKASLAALTFGNGVNQTGNNKDSTNPMTGNEVYQAVSTGEKPPEASVDQLSNIVQQGTQAGGAAAAIAASRNWRVLDEDDRRLVRGQMFAMARERAERATVKTETLWTGSCKAEFVGASGRLEFVMERGALRLESATAVLPAFDLDIDDSRWDGQAAVLVRERLAEMAFVRNLIRERIETGLADRLTAAAEKAQDNR